MSEFDGRMMKKHIKEHEDTQELLKELKPKVKTETLKELIKTHDQLLGRHKAAMQSLIIKEPPSDAIYHVVEPKERLQAEDKYIIRYCIEKTEYQAYKHFRAAFMMEDKRNRNHHLKMLTDLFGMNYMYKDLANFKGGE